MRTFWQDLRYGARLLLKNPGFTLIAILALALGSDSQVALFKLDEADFSRPSIAASSAQSANAQYRITIPEPKPRQALVEARMAVSGGRIFMNSFGADHLPKGWATFIQGLQVADENGRSLAVEEENNAAWKIAGSYSGIVKLSYQVNLSFVYESWPSGNEQAGSFQGNALFLVTRPLFITSDIHGQRQITFEAPARWKITTPWQPSPTDPRTFFVEDQIDLLSNTIVLGEHGEYRLQEGPFTFILALPGPINEAFELIVAPLKKTLRAYCRLFDRTPRTRYLMTVFYAENDDGESYARSAAFTTRNKICDGHVLGFGQELA